MHALQRNARYLYCYIGMELHCRARKDSWLVLVFLRPLKHTESHRDKLKEGFNTPEILSPWDKPTEGFNTPEIGSHRAKPKEGFNTPETGSNRAKPKEGFNTPEIGNVWNENTELGFCHRLASIC